MSDTASRELIADAREWSSDIEKDGLAKLSAQHVADDVRVLATALESALDELDAMHSWGGLMKLLQEHWPADIFGNSDGRDERADPGPRIVSLINALDASERQNDRMRGIIAEAATDANDAVDAVVNASPWQNGAATQGAATIAILEKAVPRPPGM